MSGASISSTNWSDIRDAKVSSGSLGTSSEGKKLLTPLKGVSAFLATFKVMYKEEFRKNVEFAKARQMAVSYTHLRAHETPEPSRMPSSA